MSKGNSIAEHIDIMVMCCKSNTTVLSLLFSYVTALRLHAVLNSLTSISHVKTKCGGRLTHYILQIGRKSILTTCFETYTQLIEWICNMLRKMFILCDNCQHVRIGNFMYVNVIEHFTHYQH